MINVLHLLVYLKMTIRAQNRQIGNQDCLGKTNDYTEIYAGGEIKALNEVYRSE